MNTIIESVLMAFAIATPICIVFGKAYYDLKNEISNWKPSLWDRDNMTSTRYYAHISNEIEAVRRILIKDYLNKHIDVEYGVGDCISVNGEIWEIDRIGYCEEMGKTQTIKIEARHKPKMPKESEDE